MSQDRNNQDTLIPSLDKFYELYGFYPKRLYADAGYGSLKNYQYIIDKNIENYIKFGDWARVVFGETYDLYHFNENGDLICLNGKGALKKKNMKIEMRIKVNIFMLLNIAYIVGLKNIVRLV